MYEIELYYGFEEGESGIYHAFEAADPDAKNDDDEIKLQLTAMLDIEPDSQDFNWDSMYVKLPESLIQKIKDDAVKEYLAGAEKGQAQLPDPEDNKPLTPEKLRSMAGEPVYIAAGDVCWWDIIRFCDEQYLFLTREEKLPLERYGEWLAYRYEPDSKPHFIALYRDSAVRDTQIYKGAAELEDESDYEEGWEDCPDAEVYIGTFTGAEAEVIYKASCQEGCDPKSIRLIPLRKEV